MIPEDNKEAAHHRKLSKERHGELAQADGGLCFVELFWRDHQAWLQDCGYMLRPRYHPDWKPSWKPKDKWSDMEDGLMPEATAIMDARRIKDGMDVCLKSIDVTRHEFEREIGLYFSSEPLAADPRNHCVPILDTLQVPDEENTILIVMPLLREYSNPPFDTFGEVVDFFGQVFEGIKFMHDHNVAHRDCNGLNIMMDGWHMFPDGFHPHITKMSYTRDLSAKAKFYTRTQRPPKYFLIDFGLARRYKSRNPPPLEPPMRGGDRSVPEFRGKDGAPPEPCDPFPTDIYYLGNMILKDFIEGHSRFLYRNKKYGFEFMKALADDMVAQDPAQRPTIDEVIERFDNICRKLNFWKVRSRVLKAGHFPWPSRPIRHWSLRIRYVLYRVPAIPSYKREKVYAVSLLQ
ncbi:kinase-like domain-containing protein [Mycena belliarum]|uniref:Kinase-like domain-containing protein n=1 Tax=Mycena belliarum TaxID=1033014 RepID=A0AAD6XKJ5_9AGAR|nr:kinase-like domain-containing protein [Mycena belliae]